MDQNPIAARDYPQSVLLAPDSYPNRARTDQRLWRARIQAVLASKEWRVVVWWYFALLAIAAAAKYLTAGWVDPYATKYVGAHAPLFRLLHIVSAASESFRVLRADILQTFVVVSALVLAGHLVARVSLSRLAWISTSLAAVVAFAEWFALRQTGVPLTYTNLMISIDWAREHPEVIPTVLPWTAIALVLAGAILYGGLPAAAGSSWVNRGSRGRMVATSSRLLSWLGVAMLAAAAATRGTSLPTFTQTMSPTDAFWTSTVASLADFDSESPANLPVMSRDELAAEYERIAYPLGRHQLPELLPVALGPRVPRHVILIVLETAPREYYRITEDTTFATFHAMSGSAIVNANHLTPRPSTLFAIYSMLTGTYPRPGVPIGEYGAFHNDGLASTLGAHGYETAYIDSYRVDWGYHYRKELRQQGFGTILDAAGVQFPEQRDDFTTAVAREGWSLAQALHSVSTAAAHRKHAFVTVATTLGHFPWRSRAAMEHASSAAKMHAMAAELDSITGVFLQGLDSLHLRDSTIVIVTGDHGLRYTAEFASFGYSRHTGNLDFNVPFMLYAPGLIQRRVDLPHTTSHVDIAPTLYYLLGIQTDAFVLHGENMLDARLAHRATFMMNTGIYPVDGFELEGHRFSSNIVTNAWDVAPRLSASERARYGWTETRTRDLLASANHAFNLTAAHFLHRTAEPTSITPPSTRTAAR